MRRMIRAVSGAALAGLLAASGCAYELRGRVVEGPMDGTKLLPIEEAPADGGAPVVGARLILTRDPSRLDRKDVATAVADRDGKFVLRVDEFGSGWMEEEWGLRVVRQGYGGVDELVMLPFDPKKSMLLVTLTRGANRVDPAKTNPSGIEADFDRFSRSPAGR